MTTTRIAELAGLTPDQAATKALDLRADVLEMTEATEAAVLRPEDPGGFSHGVRAALAVRIARLNQCEALSGVYRDALRHSQADEATVALADPAFDGGDDGLLRAVLAFTDRVATSPKDATAEDIDSLREAGVAEPDIVRLSQLNAFLAYEIRLIEGLRLMGASA